MTNPAFQINSINVREASQAEFTALNQHTNRIRLERLPDDPPIPLEESILSMKNIPPFVDVRLWAVWNPDLTEIAAEGSLALLKTEDNKHLAQFEITVLPDFRLQGLGRKLLRLVSDTAQENNRRLLVTETADRVPGGEAFMLRIGAHKGLETHVNQLRITDINRGLIAGWLSHGKQLSADFEIGLWDGAYPEEMITEVANLYELTNQQPFGEIEIEAMHMSPEQIRQMEQQIFARGGQRWTFYIVNRATGRFAGYTETVWNPNRPEILRQDMTGVFPEYRKLGLGRWLKAAMLDKVLKDRPQVKYIRTGNADSNAAMLKINNELGFQPYMASALWQIEVEKVQEYLNSHNK